MNTTTSGILYWIAGLINLISSAFAAVNDEFNAATYFAVMAFMLFYFGDKRLEQ